MSDRKDCACGGLLRTRWHDEGECGPDEDGRMVPPRVPAIPEPVILETP